VEVKPGYKQTEVGVIPEEWDIKPMLEFGKFAKGIGLLKEDIRSSGTIPGIPYTALYTDFSEVINYDQIRWFVDDPAKTYLVSQPCVLIASSSNMTANTGKACALTGGRSVAIGREVIIFKSPENCRFLSYLLSTPPYRKRTLTLARGTTIKHLYPATFQNYKIALPPSLQQNAIAEALSEADGLLGGLGRLIAKKRDLKQAAIQQLLTGQTRLAGFRG
jgi:type I restriction enzyme, S subunit